MVRGYGILTLLFLFLSFRATRFLELFSPCAVMLIVSGLPYFFDLMSNLRSNFAKSFFGRFGRAVVLCLFLGIIARDLYLTFPLAREGASQTLYTEAGNWLRDNAQEGDLVFHLEFDHFPYLYFYAPELRYVVGLDPRFLYFKDEELYRRWSNVSKGSTEEVQQTIRSEFGSDWVFLPRSNSRLKELLDSISIFSLEHSDKEAVVYRVEGAF